MLFVPALLTLALVPMLTVAKAPKDGVKDKTLRQFLKRGPVLRQFRRLSDLVFAEYGTKPQPELDFGEPLPFVDSDKSIPALNFKYRDILLEGDIRPTVSQLDRRANRTSRRKTRQAVRGADNLWPNGVVPYEFHPNIGASKRAAIHRALSFWQVETCLTFRKRSKEPSYLYFVGHDDGCWSTVGRDAAQGQQWLSIGDGCEPFGITSHEVAHALGLFHEQSRYDRDNHVQLVTSNVKRNLLYNFAKASPIEINHYGLPYDVGSVMHYSPIEFATVRSMPALVAKNPLLQQTMGSLEGPSFLDVAILNKHYQCAKRCGRAADRLRCQNNGIVNPRRCSQCKCPTGFTGAVCQSPDTGNQPRCGGILQASEGEEKRLTSDIPLVFLGNKRTCYYHIQAPVGRRIALHLTSVRGHCEHGCARERVEIKAEGDKRPVGYRFCCPESGARRIVSSSNTVIVMLHANSGPASVDLTYKME